jgi:acetyl-CoA carboxylase/biotin carboxylase 1
VYLQAATEFADLHDKTGRMKAKGVIKDAVPWNNSREFFFWRATRRMAEDEIVAKMCAADPALTREAAIHSLQSMFDGDWEDNKSVVAFFEAEKTEIDLKLKAIKSASMKAKIDSLKKELEALG